MESETGFMCWFAEMQATSSVRRNGFARLLALRRRFVGLVQSGSWPYILRYG